MRAPIRSPLAFQRQAVSGFWGLFSSTNSPPLGYRCIFPPVPLVALYSTCQLQSPSSSLLCSIGEPYLCLFLPSCVFSSLRMLGILPGRSLTYISWVPFLLLFSSLTAPSSFTSIWELVRNARSWDSPGGGPMVRTPYFYCSGSVLGWGTKFPHSSTKKKMQIPGPYLRSTEVQTLGMGPSNLFQHSCPSG